MGDGRSEIKDRRWKPGIGSRVLAIGYWLLVLRRSLRRSANVDRAEVHFLGCEPVSRPEVTETASRSAIPVWVDGVLDVGVRPIWAAASTVKRLAAFGLIVLATVLTKLGRARRVVHPLILGQVRCAGVQILPFVGLLAVVTGLVLIGQTITLLRQIGAEGILGTVLVVALFRELAPLATALVVLLRVGTATVVELATMRATGEVEALEALSIDPVHFLVVPRVVGMAVSVFCLTVYFLIGAILGGYVFCFVQQLPLSLGDYLGQLARALRWEDFLLLVLKTFALGASLAVITCYQGLSRPLRLHQVPDAAARAVSQSLLTWVVIDLTFLGVYLLLRA